MTHVYHVDVCDSLSLLPTTSKSLKVNLSIECNNMQTTFQDGRWGSV